jgi:hypothetical protein
MSDHASTQELINSIEKKDKSFRLAQSIFLTLLLVLLVGIVFVQFRTLDTVRQQLVASKATATETTNQSNQQRDTIIRRLDCVVAFLNQPNRTALVISDIDKCSLNTADSPTKFFAPADGTSTSTNTNGDGSTTTTTTTNNTPGNPDLNHPQPVIQQPLTPPTTVEPKPPLRVIGVPICVPFTEVCVR